MLGVCSMRNGFLCNEKEPSDKFYVFSLLISMIL